MSPLPNCLDIAYLFLCPSTYFPQNLLKLLLFFMYSGDPTARWPGCASQGAGEFSLGVQSWALSDFP